MHTNFNFSFYYPVMQAGSNSGRVKYTHLVDLLVSGRGIKLHKAQDITEVSYDFEIEEVLIEGDNILSQLSEANGLDGIKAACMHHIKQLSFGNRGARTMSYLPLRKAI